MAANTVPGAARLTTLHSGAAELLSLLHRLATKANADLCTYWAAHPDREGQDGRDYRGLADMVGTAIEVNLRHPDPTHREGFLRALTDLLCAEADECFVSLDGWGPIAHTAHSFEGRQ
jgi:hypothetical protein